MSLFGLYPTSLAQSPTSTQSPAPSASPQASSPSSQNTPIVESGVPIVQENGNGENLSPMKMLQKFFDGVKAGQVEDATDQLTQGSLLVEKKENIDALKKGTQEAVDKYGSIAGFEVIDKKSVGDHLFRIVAISLGEDMPLRWKFYFYKSKDHWSLLDMRVDSGIADLFDDSENRK